MYGSVDEIQELRAENARLQTEVERQDRENKRQRQSIRSAIVQHQYDVGHAERQRRAALALFAKAEERQEKLAQDKQKQQRYIAELIDSRFEAHQERRAAEAKLTEQKQITDAMEGRLSEIVEECEEAGEDPSYLFSMFYQEVH